MVWQPQPQLRRPLQTPQIQTMLKHQSRPISTLKHSSLVYRTGTCPAVRRFPFWDPTVLTQEKGGRHPCFGMLEDGSTEVTNRFEVRLHRSFLFHAVGHQLSAPQHSWLELFQGGPWPSRRVLWVECAGNTCIAEEGCGVRHQGKWDGNANGTCGPVYNSAKTFGGEHAKVRRPDRGDETRCEAAGGGHSVGGLTYVMGCGGQKDQC